MDQLLNLGPMCGFFEEKVHMADYREHSNPILVCKLQIIWSGPITSSRICKDSEFKFYEMKGKGKVQPGE